MVQAKSHRYSALDSLRGICASMIVLLHFHTNGLISNSEFIKNGFLFVDFFFALSGFVISASYGAKLTTGFPVGRFMILRLGRIYPLHFFVLVVFVVFEAWFYVFLPQGAGRQPFADPNSVPKMIYNVFLVQIFFGDDHTSWNIPSWVITLSLDRAADAKLVA